MTSKDVETFAQMAERIVGEDGVSRDPRRLLAASRDRYELSPLLTETLPVTTADVVVWPRAARQVADLASAAYDCHLPLTPRGKGTGNYGQAVPLRSGIVLDTSRMNVVTEVGDGWAATQSGARILAVERAARATGQELALMPSTVGSTIGGFIAGGSGGAGSIEHGWTWDGFLMSASVAPCTSPSDTKNFSAEETRPFAHAYGTTGVITDVTVKLVPARDRVALFASLPDMESAAGVGHEIMTSAVPPRLLSVDSRGISTILAPSQEGVREDLVSLRILVTPDQIGWVSSLITGAGGAVEMTQERGDASVLALAFNHVTERVLKDVDGYCHLQVSGSGLPTAQARAAGDLPGLMTHLDGFRIEDHPKFVGIIFHPYDGRASIERAKQVLADHDVRVNDPHVWQLQKNVDIYRGTAQLMDPRSLMNPGKLPPEAA